MLETFFLLPAGIFSGVLDKDAPGRSVSKTGDRVYLVFLVTTRYIEVFQMLGNSAGRL